MYTYRSRVAVFIQSIRGGRKKKLKPRRRRIIIELFLFGTRAARIEQHYIIIIIH